MSKEILKSTEQIIELVNSGIDIEKAYKLVKPHRELTAQVKRNMLEKAAKYSLSNPKRVKTATIALDKILKGEYLDKDKTIKPNSSTIIKAIEMIKDREEPKITINQNLNVSLDLSPINLDKYRTIDIVDN